MKNELFAVSNPKSLPHPREPIVTAFSLITLSATWDDVWKKILATKTARTYVIQCKFM